MSEDEKVEGYGSLNCNVCGANFKLTKDKHYIAIDNQRVGLLALTSEEKLYDAFDCPVCGCQNILGERKRNANEIVNEAVNERTDGEDYSCNKCIFENGGKEMINAKGEWIYTNSEIAYELGLSPATVNAIGRKLYGNKIPHWTIGEVRRIIEYIKSITIEEDEKRLNLLRETIKDCGYEKQDDEDVKKRVSKDLHRID